MTASHADLTGPYSETFNPSFQAEGGIGKGRRQANAGTRRTDTAQKPQFNFTSQMAQVAPYVDYRTDGNPTNSSLRSTGLTSGRGMVRDKTAKPLMSSAFMRLGRIWDMAERSGTDAAARV
jgi:hypothetical protein